MKDYENNIEPVSSLPNSISSIKDDASMASQLQSVTSSDVNLGQSISSDYDLKNKEDLDDIGIIHTKSNHIDEPEISAPPYSRFGRPSKLFLVLQCAYTGFFSSIAGAIYYPVLTVIEKKFDITEEQVNITVVVYFLFQGLSPSIMGGMADSLGRRPILLISVIVYCGACIGLACSQSYAQIIILRCLQAAGISPVITISSGVMGDITTRAERGAYVGYTSGFQVIGGAFGALIGALLASRWNWRAIFWFLAIGSGICAVFSILFLPETKRTLVGNGSVPPKNWPNKSPALLVPIIRHRLHMDDPDYETLEPRIKVNFLAPFSILKNPWINILLFVAGFQFAMNTLHQTTLSTVLSKTYHYKVSTIGVCFLPAGLCTLTSVVTTGRFLNWYYRNQMAKHKVWLKQQEEKLLKENHTIEKVKNIIDNDPYYTFNVVRVRLAPAFFTLILSACGYIAFGWCVKVKAPLPAVLVASGFGSLFSNCILTMSTTLIVDLYPSKSSTGTGCLNLFRCSLSAIFIACLSRMSDKMTYGGVFTFMGVFSAAASSLLYILVGNGKKLAFNRRKEEEEQLRKFKKEREEKEKIEKFDV
ncbi:hypothetical protein RI543_002177 [Arxiozyma heterogenica]|uniref:Major facilitator superfamily (MFS) profile domain-containing protein n=1 Tax=Arxiozyma heterogenica TaxID=278026 RepID=A0AAN8A919_9SACH|nr:hypothetical protein RI543_002177 [Kazachstania heterogenica]